MNLREKRADLCHEAERKYEDVVGFQVSVNDVLFVQVGQSTRHLQNTACIVTMSVYHIFLT